MIIEKDGKVIAGTDGIKGSTLPDSIFYYEMWHMNHKYPPNDNDIKSIILNWENITSDLDTNNITSLSVLLVDLHKIIKHLTYFPVIPSGTYKFNIGLHQNGTKNYGQPFVPRIAGYYKDDPYDGETQNNLANAFDGGFIKTLNKNKSQNFNNIANGINLHDGRHDSDYSVLKPNKLSTGCLTIRHADWEKIHSNLPNIDEWKSNNHTGKITIVRNNNNMPSPMIMKGVSILSVDN